MKRWPTIVVATLPLLGLGALWAWTEVWTQEGTDWDVPVRGYDPRDLLRGHYIQFDYDWPTKDDVEPFGWSEFCIIGTPPVVEQLVIRKEGERCDYPIQANPGSIYGEDGLMRGRLYVPQTQAGDLEGKLRDPGLQGIVTIRQRTDGRILPQSIRFRKLTTAEPGPRDADR